MKITRRVLILWSIILIGSFLRLWQIGSNPPDLHGDELDGYISARSIITTGHDINGALLPYFYGRVELHPPLYGILSYFSVRLIGETPFAIRLPAVILGIITIYLLYRFVLLLTNQSAIALFAAGSLAIIPWHIHFSRIAWGPAVMTPVILCALIAAFKWLETQKLLWLLMSCIFFGLSFYTYISAVLYSVLLFGFLCILHKSTVVRKIKQVLLGTVISLLIVIPFGLTALTQPALLDRAERIATFDNGITIPALRIFFYNYLAHFSLAYLGQSGDPNLRHGAQTGVLYWWMLPFLLIGIGSVTKVVGRRWYAAFLCFWLAIFPLAGALTNDGVPHAPRTLIGAPILCIFIGIGFVRMYHLLRYRTGIAIAMTGITFIVGVLSLIHFFQRYFIEYPIMSQTAWNYGQTETFAAVRNIAPKYDRVCLGNVNYWNSLQLVSYHLHNTSLTVYDNVTDEHCHLSRTILVVPHDISAPASYQIYTIINDLTGNALYTIAANNE